MMNEKLNRYKNLAEQLLCQVLTEKNLSKMEDAILNKDSFKKVYAKGGLNLRRGYFNPSRIVELLITNIHRGKLIKRVTRASKPDYCYYFDDERLILSEKNPGDKKYRNFEWINRENNYEYSIIKEEYSACITVSEYNKRKVMRNVFFYGDLSLEYFQFVFEKYEYDSSEKLVSAVCKDVRCTNNEILDSTEVKFNFVYQNQSLIGYYYDDETSDVVSIPPTVKSLITGEEIPELPRQTPLSKEEILTELQKIISSWRGENIYAISLFIYHDGNTITDFEISCNHEEGQVGEERWNYAFWEQDEISLNYLLEHRTVKWKKLLDLCAASIKQLQNENFLKETFGRDIAVIIHGYEYEPEELKATKTANPNGQADAFFKEMKALGMIP